MLNTARIKRIFTSPTQRKRLLFTLALLLVIILLTVILTVVINGSKNESGSLYEGMVFRAMEGTVSDNPTSGLINPDREVRGIWIASVNNINFPSKRGLDAATLKAELDDIVARCVEYGFNSIYFQVRPASDALYKSKLFPTSIYLSGTQGDALDGGFDPLAYLLEIAHEVKINVHAWVNPLRITYGTATTPKTDVNSLAANNPARLHPNWTIAYADGKLYYDAGLPEVQKLVADGVREIVEGYDVDGVVFDDYFYPYPTTVKQDGKNIQAPFNDDATYAKYGKDFDSKGDWRRENINIIVKSCYDTIKSVRESCQFGIAPFGIWRNDDGENGGSDTAGLDSYSQIYCDALAWINGGYIDYISPQIYWQFSTKVARYDVLSRWWNAQVDGTDVELIISHAAYRSSEFETENEIRNQIEFARSELAYRGSIMYGWDAVKADDMSLQRQLSEVWSDEIIYSDVTSNEASLEISSPVNGSVVAYDSTYVLGSSDPGYPLYINGMPVSRTKEGFFSLYLPLDNNINTFTFSHKGEETKYTIKKTADAKPAPEPASTGEFTIGAVTPSYDYMSAGGDYITVTAHAPSGSRVTATLNNQTVRLEQKSFPKGDAKYLTALYSGTIKLPKAAAGKLTSLGNVTFNAEKNGESASRHGAKIRLLGSGYNYAVEVIKENSDLKIATDSWFYDDYTSATAGMRDYVVSQSSGYYKLRMGGYIEQDNVRVLDPGTVVKTGVMSSAKMTVSQTETTFRFEVGEKLPLNGYIEDGYFIFCLYNMDTSSAKIPELVKNPLFSEVKGAVSARAGAYKYFCRLIDADNFYGFTFTYDNGAVVVTLRNPTGLAEGDKPLAGRTIIVDAGHGGKDSGAIGPSANYTEDDMNLDMALALAERLRASGAEVILTREEDVTVDIYDRIAKLDELRPDLCISIHQNSMLYNADVTRIRGLVGLYFAESGQLLTKCVSSALSESLNRYERTPVQQRLAMVRNPKFPSTLVEVGFITCVEEYNKMQSEDAIGLAADGLHEGILDFWREQEKFMLK